MFQHFGQRLKRDLKQLVDRRLDASVMASGGALKVCLLVLSNFRAHNTLPSQSSGVEVDVISHKRQRCVFPYFRYDCYSPISYQQDTPSGLVVPCWRPWSVPY